MDIKVLKMPKYENGRIYKIVSDCTDKVYVGSTVVSLSKRFSSHNAATERGYNKCLSKDVISSGNATIVLIEHYPCKSKEELHSREYYHIKKLKDEGANVINKFMPTRTKKEYDEQNPEKKKACDARYREKHRDELKKKAEKYKEPYQCECGKIFQLYNKGRHERGVEHQRFINNKV